VQDGARIGPIGRAIYGETPPGQGRPCSRTTPLSEQEIAEVVSLIVDGRRRRELVVLPALLRTRDWESVLEVVLRLEDRLGYPAAGWKIGAASEEVRRSEGLPSPAPGRIYAHTVHRSPARLAPDSFINYRNCECEFAFRLARDLPARSEPYDEEDVASAIAALVPAIEIGDTVFADWYGASSYFGSCLDNGGSGAFVHGEEHTNWSDLDLAELSVSLHFNDEFLKAGDSSAAMGNPLRSLTWMVNWLSSRGRTAAAGEIISTGTCTGHCFAAPGDTVRADFGSLGIVEVTFAADAPQHAGASI
jgi:2-keto-4-pentenoate hydratase